MLGLPQSPGEGPLYKNLKFLFPGTALNTFKNALVQQRHRLQPRDPVFQTGVGAEPDARAAVHHQGGQRGILGPLHGHRHPVLVQEGLQAGDHLGFARQGGAAQVGAVFAHAGEGPHHREEGQQAQHGVHELEDQLVHEEPAQAAVVVTVAAQEIGDDDAADEDEAVDHALDQRHRHHVAVGRVAQLVAQHAFQLVVGHGP